MRKHCLLTHRLSACGGGGWLFTVTMGCSPPDLQWEVGRCQITHFSPLHSSCLTYILCVLNNLTLGSSVLFRLCKRHKQHTRAISAFCKAILVFLILNPCCVPCFPSPHTGSTLLTLTFATAFFFLSNHSYLLYHEIPLTSVSPQWAHLHKCYCKRSAGISTWELDCRGWLVSEVMRFGISLQICQLYNSQSSVLHAPNS